MTPLDRFKAALGDHGSRPSGPSSWTCPAHEDRQASLSVGEGRDGCVLVKCHAGCETIDVVAALGLQLPALFPPRTEHDGKTISATYDYVDEHGQLLFQVIRYIPKTFRQRRPARPGDAPSTIRDGWVWNLKNIRRVLYQLPKVQQAARDGATIYVVEGEKDVHALERVGCVATCNPGGAGKWRQEYARAFVSAHVIVIADTDDPGRRHAHKVANTLGPYARSVRVVEPAEGKDAADHLATGRTPDDFVELAAETETTETETRQKGGDTSGTPPAPLPPARCDLATVEKLFGELVDQGDRVALRATLACYAANLHLNGDPVWLGLIAGSSTGKTETAMALRATPKVLVRSTLSGEAALLSGTPAKERGQGATGGLLREAGNGALLVLKDFTTILSMNRDKRGTILAALREIFDGHWSRGIGGEGGSTLEWSGKLGIVMCSTTAYDRAHEVIAELGDRFLLIRLADDDPEHGMLAALDGTGEEQGARAALADAVAGLLGHPPEVSPSPETAADRQRLATLANFVTLARSPVARDYRGEIELVHDREGPYRFGKQLHALWRACGLLGMSTTATWQVVGRVCRDSMPKLRWKVIAALASRGELTTGQVCAAVWHPSRTTRRTLEDLAAHRVITRRTVKPTGDHWQLTERSLATAKVILDLVPEVSPPLSLDDAAEEQEESA